MVPGGIRNIHEGKVSSQLAGASNHLSDRHGTEDYLNIVHRLSNEVWLAIYYYPGCEFTTQKRKCVKYFCLCHYTEFLSWIKSNFKFYLSFCDQESDSAMRNPSFPLRSPQSGCSPAGSDGTPKREYLRREKQPPSRKFFLAFFFNMLFGSKIIFSFLCFFFHSRISATPDSVTSSICTLSEGRRTRPETAVTAKEENPSCKRRERYVRYRKLPKQGLYETNNQAIEGQVKWVWFCRSVHILV